MNPTIGRIVHYKLTEDEAMSVNKRRRDYLESKKNGDLWANGAQAHMGNDWHAGDVFPAIIVKVWPNEFEGNKPGINAQVFLDGNDTLWITSKGEGQENGQWIWPPRI